ncbi:MAG TPA: bacillithiol biosynthesis cysteine-adding enzyme BshC [Gemmatimonadales bacterium]|jgi:bacillithiol biosynthesis cysteine-adding enzyme BshC|nr:bacillithiol biosynthesis cysteine-adding enzyme BshC [Gemmatimonadales bacterium]
MSLPIVDTPLPERPGLPEPRAEAWDRALEPALVAAPGLDAIIGRLRQPGALVVTTGQQTGLFTGPAYTVSKALSARGLALVLERRWRRPVVPVFWVPADDHDFDEVATVSWLGADGGLVTASLPPRAPEAPLTPLGREPLGAAVLEGLDRFERSFPDAATSGETVAWLRRHYRPEAAVAGAFAGAMAQLLAPLGIGCLDGGHPAVKRKSAPLILRALTRAPELDRALLAQAEALAAEGRDAGVPVGDRAALVFLDGTLGRDRLVADGSGFHTRRSKTRISLQELERIAAEAPERLSGNVLLRPVLESALLPTSAYVAGPGELRYLELAAAVYRGLEVPRQQPVPRWSGVLVEPRVTRVLAKYGAGLAELLDDDGALEARIAREALPQGAEAAFAALRAAIDRGYEPVVRAVAEVDPTLERPAASARGQALHAVGELEKKALQHARKRSATELAQIARVRLAVRPEGKPQERVLTMAGFLARYGGGLLGALADHIAEWYTRALEADPPIP